MKSTLTKFFSTSLAVFGLLGSGVAEAAKVRLEGSGFWQRNQNDSYFADGKPQSGRYTNLGADYYTVAQIGMDRIGNRSKKVRSGTLSFEFWAMPYYGAESGVVLMTSEVSPLRARQYINNARRSGYAISLGSKRYPELELFEYTGTGWVFRDLLRFKNKAWL